MRIPMPAAATIFPEIPFEMSYVRSRQLAATLAWAGVCLWILVAPFEASQPLLHLPGQSLSTVEAALVAVFVVFGIAALLSSITLKTPLTLPWIAFIATTGIAAHARGDKTRPIMPAARSPGAQRSQTLSVPIRAANRATADNTPAPSVMGISQWFQLG